MIKSRTITKKMGIIREQTKKTENIINNKHIPGSIRSGFFYDKTMI